MLECNQCGNQQEEGKFCGSCGSELVAANPETNPGTQASQAEAAPTTQTAPVAQASEASTNETVENIKQSSAQYWEYFKASIKNPSGGFAKGETELKNGIINIVLFAILFALTIYTVMAKAANKISSLNPLADFGLGISIKPPFVSTFATSTLIALVMVFVVISVLFIVNKLFGSDSSYKTIISLLGYHASLAVAIVVVSLLLALIGSIGLAMPLLYGAMILIVGVGPLYLISSLLTRTSKGLDAFYAYLIYIVGVSVVSFILTVVVFASMLSSLTGGLL